MDRKGRSPGWWGLNDGLPRGWALEGLGLGRSRIQSVQRESSYVFAGEIRWIRIFT